MTPSKARRVTQQQQEMLLQFMQENPEFSARRAINPLNRSLYDQKWEELAITLNGGGEGSQKSVAEWRKVGESPPLVATSLPQVNLTWSDWRKNVRLKATGYKDGEAKIREGPRTLSSVERRLLELVGTGTPPKQPTNPSTQTPVAVTTTIPVVVANHPPVNYSVPQPVLLPQQTSINFSTMPTTVFPKPTVRDEDVEVLDEAVSDPENSGTTVSKSRDECTPSQRSSPPHVHFPRQATPATEPKRVGGVIGFEGGNTGVRRHGNLEERRLALDQRRLHLEERRLKLEERRVQHEEWRATMDRESHQVDMDMKRALLDHMRHTQASYLSSQVDK